ncbi:hypothetical protein AXG93_3384s1620 [Marchantia polymorpha subsp. ruderalis]|uniref:Uncharacterized protein n=1 Tax=Marchantia polymorpha subsp. ruderalis TaxID=1480154 RepID=A0A176WEL7_MARPO|nr:hypothetical protein AXG93_3384s1620 [Marchantia polymorpha subsp. ruderalis]
MAARIEQLEQRLAAMVGLEASTSTSYEGKDFFYLASAAQVEASVAVTRGGARSSEPRGATMELDPQRGEGGWQARLPQSFLLSEVSTSSSMRHAPPNDTGGRTETLTSSVVNADVPSGVVMRIATSVLRSSLFSATKLMDSASVAGFSGVLTWRDDLLEGNMSADDISVYEDVEEVVSFATVVPSFLDVPLWSSCQAL